MQWYLRTLAEIINQAGWPLGERGVPSASPLVYVDEHRGIPNVLIASLLPLIKSYHYRTCRVFVGDQIKTKGVMDKAVSL